MKSPSAQARAAIDSPHVEPIRLLTIAFESGLTLRLCDRVWGDPGEECRFDGELYEPLVIAWGDINRGAIDPVRYSVDPGEAGVTIDNTVPVGGAERFAALFAAHDPHYATAAIAEIFAGAQSAADQVDLFAGRIEDALDMATDRVTLVLSGSELDIANRFDHTIITTDLFSSADPDDVGKMLGQGYGRLKRVPLRAVDAGNRTTLVADIGAADTSIPISDATGFPASGTVQIELEKITYTGITANTLTGCARGQSGTTAQSHDSGSAVSEIQSEYVYAWGHPIQMIEAVYVDRVRQSGNHTAYTGLAGDEHPSYPGRAIIAFTTMPSLNRQINIDDQISVDQGDHQHGNLTYTTLFAESIRSNSGIEYPERIPGNAFDTQAFVHNGASGTFNFLGYKDPGGTPVRWRVGLVYRRPVGSSEARIRSQFRASDGTLISRVSLNHGDYAIHNAVSAWESCAGVTWAEISAGYFTVSDYDISGNPINCCCTWLDVEHTVDSSPADGVLKLGTVVLSGNSGADVVIGSEVAADIRGWQDDALGTYTGTAFGLIERPEHICRHILMDRCGLPDTAIGASYTAAGAFYAANSYRLGVAILERPNVRELLNQIAVQARSLEFWEAGVHHLAPSGNDVNVVKTLTAERLDQGQIRLQYTPRVDIVNRMAARYGREWSGHNDAVEADRAIVNAENTASIAKFGALEGEQLEFPFIIDAAQAQDVLDWRLKERAFPRLVAEMACGYYAGDLERGDAIGFDFAPGDVLDQALLRLVQPGIDFFRIMDMVDGPDAAIRIKAVFAVAQFDLTASMAGATATGAAMLVLDFDLTAVMAGATQTAAIELIRLNELAAAMTGATQTSAIELLNVGATFELTAAMAGETATPAVNLAIDYDISAAMAGATATSAIELFNPLEFSAVMAGVTQTSDIILGPLDFVFEVVTTGADETFTLPLIDTGTYNFQVFWGDGQDDTITAYNDPAVTHTYVNPGTHDVTILGTINGWRFANSASAPKVYDVKSWGPLQVGSTGNQFNGCSNMTVSAPMDSLDISGVTNMFRMFSGCSSFNGDLSGWDVSGVTNLSFMFFGASSFTSDLSGWNVSSCTNLSGTFYNASSFTTDCGSWDVSNCTNFSSMFLGAALTNPHYDSLLIGWSALTLTLFKSFNAGAAKYSAGAAATARQHIIDTYFWTIQDGGQLL